ncbi:MAG: hypothetical protein KGJ89_03175 [Patescibacteria group bacterium]|nr:hypothetical protein [Patescibacteria group bacterium]MDE2015447.1 hypothetical protein [Patescibacteria group bacterium]MDE2226937.1 hypothetical protein [Patescibacteria group bacterium]
MNKNKIALSTTLIGVCALAGYILYESNLLPGFSRFLPNCLRFQTGTGVLEVTYPPQFIDVSDYGDAENAIRIKRRDSINQSEPANEGYILGADSAPGEDVPFLLSGKYMGLKFSSSTLNGYEAAYSSSTDASSTKYNDYVVSAGDTDIHVFYEEFPEMASSDYELLDQMLHTIKIRTATNYLRIPQIVKCAQTL